MTTLAVYAGSFDPPTNGHAWMIERGSAMFGRLIVAVGQNPEKRCAYELDQRVTWLTEMSRGYDNVEVASFGNLFLAQFTESVGASYILRGIRNESDYTYERTMRNVNGDLHSGLTTVFLMPPRDIAEVSSSMIRGMIGPVDWQGVVRRYVPENVYEVLVRAHEDTVG